MTNAPSAATVRVELVQAAEHLWTEGLGQMARLRQEIGLIGGGPADAEHLHLSRSLADRAELMTEAERARIPRHLAGWGPDEVAFGWSDAVTVQPEPAAGTVLLVQERWCHEASLRIDLRCWFPSRVLQVSQVMAQALPAVLAEHFGVISAFATARAVICFEDVRRSQVPLRRSELLEVDRIRFPLRSILLVAEEVPGNVPKAVRLIEETAPGE